jgi:tRNA-uridine 2-sulfurtransferase
MNQEPRPDPVSAVLLLSGGLDSQLAVCVLKDQGIAVHGLTFESPFFTAASARRAAEQLRIPLIVEDFTVTVIGLVQSPRHGFGGGMNPCIDCHTAMVRRAGQLMRERRFQLVATGEVLDERPMSQNRRSLDIVARESGCEGWLLRPLSAQLLDETEPERRGWVDRARLLALRGRSRRVQMDLANRYGLADYPTPAGGCCLTEPNYSKRLRDLKRHEGLQDLRRVRLLRFGRHFRLGDRVKAIAGRDRQDNDALERLAGDDLVLRVEQTPGATVLLPATAAEDAIRLAAAICARYSDTPRDRPVMVRIRAAAGIRALEVLPAGDAELERLRV